MDRSVSDGAVCEAHPEVTKATVGVDSDAEFVEVRDLVEGDVFEWCGRRVTLLRFAFKSSARPGRYLFVDESGAAHRLHYYDDEVVSRVGHDVV